MTLLRYDKNYFWKIIAKDDYQNMTEGPVWSFQTLLGETVFNGTFDTDAENKNPSNRKWSIRKEFGADIFVTNEKSWNNQGKSVCFTDSTIESNSYLAASVAPKKVGMLQLHFLMTSENDYFGVRLYSEKADSNHLGPQVSIREGKLQYYDKSREWNTITTVEINSWYFLQLVFDCDQHYYNLFLNDRLTAENVTWTGTNVATVNSFYFLTFQNRICKKSYIDDVKFFSYP